MEDLRNLQQMGSLAGGKFNQYDGEDFILPQVFKDNVKEINNCSITYNKYSAIIETPSNQHGMLNIFMPNQWFFIASYFTDFYNELQKYKKYAMKVASKERLKNLNGGNLNRDESSNLMGLDISDTSKNYLERFMTDYTWWGGAKTIDRGDFYVSPILNYARLVNASQSFVADLCAFLADKHNLVNAIISEEDENPNKSNRMHYGLPLQQIYYGAPGTGKSHAINKLTEGENVIRTTFHPDSDYSTFVGAYKPTMGLLPICDELGQPMKIGSTVLHKEQIIYEFVDQAFLQAYVQAWKFYAENADEAKKQYLVIEEINRGNCAQIFGDLFQLLDRNDYGFSVYPINADKDMKKQLAKAFKGLNVEGADKINALYKGKDVVSQVLSGDILLLPDNLYIWATMNTSDQSLFPIDSAFKRRWEWQYMPIDKGYDENGNEIKWAIEGATKKYSWWSFLEKINAQIGEATQSEDKKLGFFFCKAINGVISAEKFVGKVIFYLWNDVFKNNGFEGPIFKDVDGTELSFSKFYKSDMKGNAIVQKDKVEVFLNNLGVEIARTNNPTDDLLPEVDEDGNNASSPTKDYSKYAINGSGSYSKGSVVLEAMKIYIANNPQKNAQDIVNDWLALGVNVPNFVETQAMFDERKQKSKDSRINEKAKSTTLGNGETLYVSNQYNPKRIADAISKVNAANWNIIISKI